MRTVIVILTVLLATGVQAGELRITENETGIIAEFTGTSADTGTDSATPPTTKRGPDTVGVERRTALIERLKNEADELSRVTGNESVDELTAKSELFDDTTHKIELFTMEFRQAAGNALPTAMSNAQSVAAGIAQPVVANNSQPAVVNNAQQNAADGTAPKVETIAQQRNKRQTMITEERARKEALLRYLVSTNQ